MITPQLILTCRFSCFLQTTCKHSAEAPTHQTLLVARFADVTDVDPQRLLPQCTVGYLHAEHLVELHHVVRQRAACSEEAASILDAGQHRRTHVPAGDTEPLNLTADESHEHLDSGFSLQWHHFSR